MSFTPVNAAGAYFCEQLGAHALDPFAVLGIPASDLQVTIRGIRHHYRMVMIPHIFERGDANPPPTFGPRVPTWAKVNSAKEMLSTVQPLAFEHRQWGLVSTQTWNTFTAPGSPESLLPRDQATDCKLTLTAFRFASD